MPVFHLGQPKIVQCISGLSSAELWPSRNCVWDHCFSGTLRPVIPQQILHNSLSFKPHKARVEVKARRLESDLCCFVGIKMWLLGENTESQAVILRCWVVLLWNCGKTLSGEGVELLWYSQACVTNPAVTWGTSSQACNVIDVWDRWWSRGRGGSDIHSKNKCFEVMMISKWNHVQPTNYTGLEELYL